MWSIDSLVHFRCNPTLCPHQSPQSPLAASKPALLGTRSNRNPSILLCTIWLWCVLWFSGWELYCFSGRIWFLLMDSSTGVEWGGGCEQERGRGSAPVESLINTLKHDIIGGKSGALPVTSNSQTTWIIMVMSASHPIPTSPCIGASPSGSTGRGTFGPGSVFVSCDTIFSRSTLTLECYPTH